MSVSIPIGTPHQAGLTELQHRLQEVCRGRRIADIAECTGFHPETTRRYIRGASPSASFLIGVCKSFDVRADWLLLGRGSPYHPAKLEIDLRRVDASELCVLLEAKVKQLEELSGRVGMPRVALAPRNS